MLNRRVLRLSPSGIISNHVLDTGYIAPSSTLRLANQNGAGCGRVEVLHLGVWGTVCDDGWGVPNAAVACRQLGRGLASFSGRWDGQAPYGEGAGGIWLDDVGCSGTELSLEGCTHRDWGSNDCYHSEDVGICCSGT